MKTLLTAKLSAILGAALLAGALMTAGCDSSEERDCQGADCLNPVDQVDSGEFGGDLPCDVVCSDLFDACGGMMLPKAAIDRPPQTVQDCVTLCEKGLTMSERRCLFESGCEGAPLCLEEAQLW